LTPPAQNLRIVVEQERVMRATAVFIGVALTLSSNWLAHAQPGPSLDIPGIRAEQLVYRPGVDPDMPPADPVARFGDAVVLADGVSTALLSRYFPAGIALGTIARDGRNGDRSPTLSIYLSGLITINASLRNPLEPSDSEANAAGPAGRRDEAGLVEGVGLFKRSGTPEAGAFVEIAQLDRSHDHLAPFWSEPASICDAPDGAHQIYAWSNATEPGWDGQWPTLVITWYDIRARGDCGGVGNTFQIVIAADTDAPPEDGKPPAVLQYRYDPMGCGWTAATPPVSQHAKTAGTSSSIRPSYVHPSATTAPKTAWTGPTPGSAGPSVAATPLSCLGRRSLVAQI
jgi:hypothetical protein